jgi:diguanylate cyclase (GGDEF)-like protein
MREQTVKYLRFTAIAAAIASALLLASVGRTLVFRGVEVGVLLVLFGVIAWLERVATATTVQRDRALAENHELQTRLNGLQQRSKEMMALVELGENLRLASTVAEANEIIRAFGPHLMPGWNGAVYLAGGVRAIVELAASWGTPPSHESFATSDCWALRRGATHTVARCEESLRCRHMQADERSPRICVPMLALGEAIGVLTVGAGNQAVSGDGAGSFAKALGDQVALAIGNLRLQETLRDHAVRDPLTTLFNRRQMEGSLASHLLTGSSTGTSTGIAIIDVDHFKQFNDTWGHAGGDALLQQLARSIESVLCDGEVLCRYGGDELVAITPGMTLELLRARAERMCEAVRNLRVRIDDRAVSGITVSIGIAVAPDHGTSAETLFVAADRGLYAAKSGGRNRVGAPPHLATLDAA